jgi:dTDP-4-dehydrorhamnose 3,5-epimerase
MLAISADGSTKLNIVSNELNGVLLIEPRVLRDDRGFFLESYNEREMQAIGIGGPFVQDNHSRSKKNVLRGLHYQLPPCAQGKLVRVITGEIFDVAVDLRRSSPTFGRWMSARLSGENLQMLWIPPGFAHGFLALTDSADVMYKTTNFYSSTVERTIRWNDPQIGISWPLDSKPLVSSKDRAGVSLPEAEVFG